MAAGVRRKDDDDGRRSALQDPVRANHRIPLPLSPLSIGLGIFLVIMEGTYLRPRIPSITT